VTDSIEKAWWQSRTIIGSLITVAASVAGIAGYTLDVPLATELALSVVTLVGGVLSWYGRLKAEKIIDKRQVVPGVRIE
jgi:hypothetical protein